MCSPRHRVPRGISPHCICTSSLPDAPRTITGCRVPGAILNFERAPSIGLKMRKRLPRSSMQMREYRPHMHIRFSSPHTSILRYRPGTFTPRHPEPYPTRCSRDPGYADRALKRDHPGKKSHIDLRQKNFNRPFAPPSFFSGKPCCKSRNHHAGERTFLSVLYTFCRIIIR